MELIKAPCKGCQDRWVNENTTCHSECEKYKVWSTQQKRQKIKSNLQRKLDNDSYSTLESMAIRKSVRNMQSYRRDK